MSGKGVVAHNRRLFISENEDPTRTHLNIEYTYLKVKIQSLATELATVKAELAQYKSVRAKLRTPDLEQENDRLRKRIRTCEEVISKNNLWHFFNESRNRDKSRLDL